MMVNLSKQQLANWWLLSVVFVGLSLPLIWWLDKPLALYIHAQRIDQHLFIRHITEGIPAYLPLAIILLLQLQDKSGQWWLRLVYGVYFFITLQLTMEVKTGLKVIFGRYWPKTWINNNLSLLHDGVFGFNWWQGHGNQGCFPSGHSTFTAFCCCWIIVVFPRLRWAGYLLLATMPVALVSLDYHFAGDCAAGIGLGLACASLSLFIAQLAERAYLRYKQLK